LLKGKRNDSSSFPLVSFRLINDSSGIFLREIFQVTFTSQFGAHSSKIFIAAAINRAYNLPRHDGRAVFQMIDELTKMT